MLWNPFIIWQTVKKRKYRCLCVCVCCGGLKYIRTLAFCRLHKRASSNKFLFLFSGVTEVLYEVWGGGGKAENTVQECCKRHNFSGIKTEIPIWRICPFADASNSSALWLVFVPFVNAVKFIFTSNKPRGCTSVMQYWHYISLFIYEAYSESKYF
jgi:hypothetical protein